MTKTIGGNEIAGQAFVFNFDLDGGTAVVAAVVRFDDGGMLVGGLNGVLPEEPCRALIEMADANGAKIQRPAENDTREVIAITFGDIDMTTCYEGFCMAVAGSQTKAMLKTLKDVGIDLGVDIGDVDAFMGFD